ncbi:MAG TPA: FAD-dependent oxidoreductase, partial [Solirubrobacterales bacterium]|nr:FAD-dependent oxidoreductase [Solirubrobacterales bacterium]
MLTRARAIEEIARRHFEVVVVGGGITGAGVALDAASRGYSVALLERGDYALGTSSRSSKMVHGGLRYLQNFDLGLVREALLERQLMVRLAPHLVYPTPFLVAALGEERRDRKLGLGLNMYDVMATTRAGRSRRERRSNGEQEEDYYWSPDRHRTIDRDEVLDLVPALAPRDPKDAYLFYDCQTDDVRLVLTILGEAERYGAVFVNGAEVTGLLDRDGQACGVACVDAETGETFEVEADNVVNATGVWADRIRPEEIYDEEEVP